MRTTLFLLLFLSGLIFYSAANAQQPQRGITPIQITIDGQTTVLYKQSHALLIGVSNYTNGLPSLPGVSEDIQAVKIALENNGFETRVVMDPDNIGLQNAFNSFIADYGQNPESRLLIYFAGHGYTKKMTYGDDIGYILPANCPNPETNPNDFQTRAMPMGQIELFADQIQAKHALFMFDACFSGSIFTPSRDIPGIITYKTTKPVRQFITSGSADETVPDKSIFRRQFIAALNGEADYNKDGFVTATELGDFLQTQVINYSKNSQHPQFGKIRNPNLDKGDFVFVLTPPSNTAPSSVTIEEKPIIPYGKVEITTQFGGSLFLDDNYMKNIVANTVVTLNDIPSGLHKITIRGDENLENSVEVNANQVSYLTFEKKKDAIAAGSLPEIIFVQGGTFQMGSNEGETNEKPIHPVTLSDFSIGKYDVTQRQWYDIMGNNPSHFKNCDNCPVEEVSWNDVQEFIRKLNQKTGKNYRLPTEAEWEYAARGGNKSRGYIYSGSNNIDDVAWYKNNSGSKTHPVGQKQANELGLYDMSGNVMEWCGDWYGNYSPDARINPEGHRVSRGGSWACNPRYCRSSGRYRSPPWFSYNSYGFRLVLVP